MDPIETLRLANEAVLHTDWIAAVNYAADYLAWRLRGNDAPSVMADYRALAIFGLIARHAAA